MRDLEDDYECEGQIELVDYLEWLCEKGKKELKGKEPENEKRESNV